MAERFDPIKADRRDWVLDADPARIEAVAQVWWRLGRQAASRGDDVARDTRRLLTDSWNGTARNSFDQHKDKLVTSLDTAEAEAYRISRELNAIASLLRSYQSALDAERTNASSRVNANADATEFWPASPEQVIAAHTAIAQARVLRADLDNQLTVHLNALTPGRWGTIRTDWQSVVNGSADTFAAPAESTGLAMLMVDGQMVVNTGPGDDKIEVKTDPATGKTTLIVNGTTRSIDAGVPVTIRAGDGNDLIKVAQGTNLNVTLLGGKGDDEIIASGGNDTIIGGHGKDWIHAGDGRDYVSGGSGHDYIDGQGGDDTLTGGLGNDSIYGLGGDDYQSGGDGRDYLEGARGADRLDGGLDADVLSGGLDDDRLYGGTGDDVMYAGAGADHLSGGGGTDTAYGQAADVTTGATAVNVNISGSAGFIVINGSPEFQERVLADLDMYRASPTAQQMMNDLQSKLDPNPATPGTNTLRIEEYDPHLPQRQRENGAAGPVPTATVENQQSYIKYNPANTFDQESGRPSIVLYHEFGHIYDFWHRQSDSTRVPSGPDAGIYMDEHRATGINIQPNHLRQFTENGLRDEMRHPERTTYKTEPGDGW